MIDNSIVVMTVEKTLSEVGNVHEIMEGEIEIDIVSRSASLIKKMNEIYAIDSICGEGCGSLDNCSPEGFCIR